MERCTTCESFFGTLLALSGIHRLKFAVAPEETTVHLGEYRLQVEFISQHYGPTMPVSARRLLGNLVNDLRAERDELALQIHLGKQEAKTELQSLGKKLDELERRCEPMKNATLETSEHVWDAVQLVAVEIKDGFHRIRKSLP